MFNHTEKMKDLKEFYSPEKLVMVRYARWLSWFFQGHLSMDIDKAKLKTAADKKITQCFLLIFNTPINTSLRINNKITTRTCPTSRPRLKLNIDKAKF